MWTCSVCGRIFAKANQPHSCNTIPLDQHFHNKDAAKELFDCLVTHIHGNIGTCRILSIPCCIHLFGSYDFLAALPKRDKLEIRFALDRKLDSPRLTQCVPLSAKHFKNCIEIKEKIEIDKELLRWISQSYHLKDRR